MKISYNVYGIHLAQFVNLAQKKKKQIEHLIHDKRVFEITVLHNFKTPFFFLKMQIIFVLSSELKLQLNPSGKVGMNENVKTCRIESYSFDEVGRRKVWFYNEKKEVWT